MATWAYPPLSPRELEYEADRALVWNTPRQVVGETLTD